jgi:transcriptional regulator with XRE-family HTH domain
MEGVRVTDVVDDDLARGQALQRRRLAQGFSPRKLHERSGVSREAITAAEAGKARVDTYQRLEAFFDAWEHEVGEEEMPIRPIGDEGRFVEVELFRGNVRAIVKAPLDDPAALRVAVANILAGIAEEENSAEHPKG